MSSENNELSKCFTKETETSKNKQAKILEMNSSIKEINNELVSIGYRA